MKGESVVILSKENKFSFIADSRISLLSFVTAYVNDSKFFDKQLTILYSDLQKKIFATNALKDLIIIILSSRTKPK